MKRRTSGKIREEHDAGRIAVAEFNIDAVDLFAGHKSDQ